LQYFFVPFSNITFHAVYNIAVCECKRSANFKDQSPRQMMSLSPKKKG